jgi:hypothetical protein
MKLVLLSPSGAFNFEMAAGFFVYLCTSGLIHHAEEEEVRGRKEGRRERNRKNLLQISRLRK